MTDRQLRLLLGRLLSVLLPTTSKQPSCRPDDSETMLLPTTSKQPSCRPDDSETICPTDGHSVLSGD